MLGIGLYGAVAIEFFCLFFTLVFSSFPLTTVQPNELEISFLIGDALEPEPQFVYLQGVQE
jgi:hypothetical protein